ncbi:MAG: hypothetical protein ACLQVI_37265 [Polyangiaceae bacterium]
MGTAPWPSASAARASTAARSGVIGESCATKTMSGSGFQTMNPLKPRRLQQLATCPYFTQFTSPSGGVQALA